MVVEQGLVSASVTCGLFGHGRGRGWWWSRVHLSVLFDFVGAGGQQKAGSDIRILLGYRTQEMCS